MAPCDRGVAGAEIACDFVAFHICVVFRMNIIGHANERELLGRMVRQRAFSDRAFLFFGPSGIGKSLVAEEFARKLLGGDNDVDRELSQDLLILTEDGDFPVSSALTKDCSIDSIREAKDFLSRFPSRGAFRVVLVLGADSLNHASQNALLKILEEPNDTSVLVLVANDRGMMLPTVLSRVRQSPFALLSEQTLRKGIEDGYPGRTADLEPFFFTLGRPGVLIRALDHPEVFAKKRELLRGLFRVSTLSYSDRAKLSAALSDDTSGAIDLLEWWLSGLRASALREVSPDRTKRFFELLALIDTAIRTLRTVPANTQLLLDTLLFSF